MGETIAIKQKVAKANEFTKGLIRGIIGNFIWDFIGGAPEMNSFTEVSRKGNAVGQVFHIIKLDPEIAKKNSRRL